MKNTFITLFKHLLGLLISLVVFATSGALIVGKLDAAVPSDPGVFSEPINLLIIVLAQYIALVLVNNEIKGGRIRKFSYTAALYYVLVIFVMQLETFFFKNQIGITTDLAIRLFFFGAPLAIIIPLYLNLYPSKSLIDYSESLSIKDYSTAKFIFVGSIAYICIYVLAGYYLAWIHEDVRSFYGAKEELNPFFLHVLNLFTQHPSLLLLQLVRGALWSIFIFLFLREMQNRALWQMIILLTLLVAIPQNIAHIGQNPIITDSKVRIIHMIETMSSMIFYSIILVYLFKRFTKKEVE